MFDLRSRVIGHVQITTDAIASYREAINGVFGDEVDYARIVKDFDDEVTVRSETIFGEPDWDHISTSLVERQNLTMRMSMKRYARKTNAHSKKFENHLHALALYFTWYNWIRVHETPRTTPAVAVGLTDDEMDMEWLLELIDQNHKRGVIDATLDDSVNNSVNSRDRRSALLVENSS